MQSLSQAECLALWESGRALHPLDQGLLAVQSAFPASRSVADWPLGRRNGALAELHCASFGRWLRGWTACEHCGEKLEFEVDGHGLIASAAGAGEDSIQCLGREFRLPSSRDLAAVVNAGDGAMAAADLLRRCAVRDSDGLDEISEDGWGEEEMQLIEESMAVADPLAEILLHFDCPVCAASFEESLDLASFLWAELESRAKRLLRDVHALAMAYGWGESEILSLSTARRNFYLEMVRG